MRASPERRRETAEQLAQDAARAIAERLAGRLLGGVVGKGRRDEKLPGDDGATVHMAPPQRKGRKLSPAQEDFKQSRKEVRESNRDRGLSAKLSGIIFAGHHPRSRVAGGAKAQKLEVMTGALHTEFETRLRRRTKEADLPNWGGKGGSYRDWRIAFRRQPDLKKAFDRAMRETAQEFDEWYGTDLLGGLEREVARGRKRRR